VPIVAPTMGGLLLLVGSWRLIFGAMLALCVVMQPVSSPSAVA
jgi:DHA1 family bicyclomycin/chloramphenicol resistance-like MFS transporter